MPYVIDGTRGAAVDVHEVEDPIGASTVGRKSGRKASIIKAEFRAVPGVGGKCLHCNEVAKTTQQNGTILAEQLFSRASAPLLVRQSAWDACATLQRSAARPIDLAVVTTVIAASRFAGGGSGKSSVAAAARPSGLQPAAGSMHKFLDRVTTEQRSAIESSIMRFFVANRVPFLVVESTSFIGMLRAVRPALVDRNLVRSRKKMDEPGLTAMYTDTRKQVSGWLAAWCVRRNAVLVLNAWENVKHNHIVNLLAVVGDKVIFQDSIYCGDECQDAPG